MSETLSIAASGLQTEDFFINSIAHDLANLNTPNYKAGKLSFADQVYQDLTASPSSGKIGLGTSISKASKDFSPGPLKDSANWNDIAIHGQGFFQVITKDGSLVYTRNSSLSIDEDNYLATSSGERLADNIQIPEDFVSIAIHKNGEVEATLPDSSEPQALGQISLAKFSNPEDLSPLGSGLYQANDQSGEPIIDNPGNSGIGNLEQHQIEASNVDMVATLMQLTMAQRIYQLNAKALQIADEMEKMTNELRN